MRLGFAIGALSLVGLASCVSPQITGRYASATCVDEREGAAAAQDCSRKVLDADVSVVLAPTAAPSAVRGTGLPEHALAAYINAVSAPRFSDSAEALRRNLAASLDSSPAMSLFRDASAASGLLTVTITNGAQFNAADRIEQATVRIQLLGATFSNWTSAKTAYSEIRPGTITGSREVNLAAGLSTSPPTPFPLSLTASGSAASKREESVTPVLQVEDITPRIESSANRQTGSRAGAVERQRTGEQRDAWSPGAPDTLVIERNGGFTRDLRGNAQIEVSIRPGSQSAADRVVFTVSGYNDDAAPRARAVSLTLTPEVRRILVRRLEAKVVMEYVVRHIVSGDGTNEDGDDRVQFMRRSTGQQRVLLSAGSPLYGLMLQTSRTMDFLRIRQHAGDVFGMEFCFADQDQAERLLNHLTRHPSGTVAGRLIGFMAAGRLKQLMPGLQQDLLVMSGCGGTPNESEASDPPRR